MKYVLDTNIIIHLINGKAPQVLKKIKQVKKSEVLISTISCSELWYGAWNSQKIDFNIKRVEAFLSFFETLPFNSEDAKMCGELRAKLKKTGKVVGPNDLLIASQAMELGATLITANEKEFSSIKGLKLENWLRL